MSLDYLLLLLIALAGLGSIWHDRAKDAADATAECNRRNLGRNL